MNEDTCQRHEKDIEELKHDMVSVKIQLSGIKSDTEYIKQKLENGIFKTLGEIKEKIAVMCPEITDHGYWIGKIKWGTATITIMAVGGGLVAFLLKAINNN